MEWMSGRERIMTALRGGQPDRVPVTPDMSIMMPVKLTGKPFWEVEVNNNPPLTHAYINSMKYFGIEGWMFNGSMQFKYANEISVERRIIRQDNERWEIQYVYQTPDGYLSETVVTPRGNPSTTTEKLIKNFKEDFPKIRHLYADVLACDATDYHEQIKLMNDQGVVCFAVSAPGFHVFFGQFHGNLEAVTYAYYDYPELFEELVDLYTRQSLQKLEMAIDNGAESILTGGSGTVTMQSPEIFRSMSLPFIKKVTKICKQAGVLSGIHSCGKQMALVEACAMETDLDYVNPLEIPPMGDCNLAECKRRFGDKLALMGNLHTTDVMLYGSVKQVRLESLRALRDAGVGGGFVLSTGDQCSPNTPEENIREMVRVGKEYGQYPLDINRIESEIEDLLK